MEPGQLAQQKAANAKVKDFGCDFDKAYVSNMTDDHKMDIKEFEDATKN
ncbi:hypothetical protein [Mucilaginibacter sp. PPCGB 2223]|nr:hypothetical protein [Mucilaginibacter sp. PPCGB 2223]